MITGLIAWGLLQASTGQVSVEAFRRPDKTGAPCSSCHTPDGFELGLYAFSEKDLARRAARHFDTEGQRKVVAYLKALQQTVPGPKADPMAVRFMQPGGSVLPGATATERDNAFLGTLKSRVPVLFGAPPSSLAEARKVATAALDIDLYLLPLGIPFNRLSEDVFHGAEHATIADWMPDTSIPQTLAVKSAEDAYLASPTNENYRALDQAVLSAPLGLQEASQLAVHKYRSLLYATHRLRIARGMAPGPYVAGPPPGNPLWQLGEFAQTHDNLGLAQLGMPTGVIAAKSVGPSYNDQLTQMRVPWWWLGWMADPGLRNSGGGLERGTFRADFFVKALIKDGPYPAHTLFMLTRKLAEQLRATPKKPFDLQYSFLLISQDPLLKLEPIEPTAKKLFRQFAHVSFKTNLYLLLDDLKTSKLTIYPESQKLQMEQIRAYLKATGNPEDQLIDETEAVLKVTPAYGRGPSRWVVGDQLFQ